MSHRQHTDVDVISGKNFVCKCEAFRGAPFFYLAAFMSKRPRHKRSATGLRSELNPMSAVLSMRRPWGTTCHHRSSGNKGGLTARFVLDYGAPATTGSRMRHVAAKNRHLNGTK